MEFLNIVFFFTKLFFIDDSTRVILKNGPTGDYINASYINMEIPNSDLVLTYIATQGKIVVFFNIKNIYIIIILSRKNHFNLYIV